MALKYEGPWQARLVPDPATWVTPDDCDGAIDLRSTAAQAAQPGTQPPGNDGVFSCTTNPGPDYELLPETFSPSDRDRLRSKHKLKEPLKATNPIEYLHERLTQHGDPTGDTFARPFVPGVRKKDIFIGSDRKPARISPLTNEPLRALLQLMYAAKRADGTGNGNGNGTGKHYLKWLGYEVRKYNLKGNEYRVIQGGLPDELPHEPATTQAESFDKVDSIGLGPDLVWLNSTEWDTVSQQATRVNNSSSPQLPSAPALSGEDITAQVVVNSFTDGAANQQFGPGTRLGTGPTSGMVMRAIPFFSPDEILITKWAAGVATDGPNAIIGAIAPGTLFTMEADGSTFTITTVVGTASWVDTTFATGAGGLGGQQTSGQFLLDNYFAEDISPAAPWRTLQRSQIIGGGTL